MKKTNLIMLSAGVIALSAAAFAAVPAFEKVQSLDNTKIRHLDGTAFRAPQRAMSLPYLIEPTEEQWGQCVILDENQDGKTWAFYNLDGVNVFHYWYHGSNPGDDWAILPSVTLTPGTYRLSSEYKTRNYPESYRIAIGTEADPAALTQIVTDCENVKNDSGSFVLVENEFQIETEGEYYVGLYCYSAANQYMLYVRNIGIEKLDPTKPMTPSIESIDFSGENGTISVKVPDSKLNGESLAGTPLSLDVTIDEAAVEGSPFSVTAGEVKDIAMTLPRGMHTVAATVSYDDNGETKTSEATSQEFKVIKNIEIPMPLPAYIAPDEDEFGICTVIDANNDNTKWEFATTGFAPSETITGAFRFAVGYSNSGDDWLILPAMKRGDSDSFEMNYKIATKYDYERYEIYKASEPTVEAMLAGQKLIEEGSIKTSDTWVDKNVKFTHSETETFYIGIHASSPMYRGFMYFADFEVKSYNNATPKKPVFSEFAFDGGDGNVNIQLPSQCFNDDAISASEVTVSLTIDGEDYGTKTGAPGATVSFPVTGLALGDHTFTAKASYINNGEILTSDPETAIHKIIKPSSFTYTLPADFNFLGDESGQMSPVLRDDFVIIDSNADNTTWVTSISGLSYSYNMTNPGDDWAILAVPVEITDASKTYQITLRAKGSSYPEAFAVYYGSAPTVEQLTTKVLDEPEFKIAEYTDCVSTFTVPAAGRYYFGIHCYSMANQFTFYISNMTIEVAPSPESPGLVEELTATPDPTGLLKATVAFNMPSLNRAGEEMPADTQLTATVTSAVETKTVTGTPGQAVSTEINTAEGQNTITVQAENAEGLGEESEVEVRCGLDTPKAPVITSAVVSEDGLGVTLTWEPVTEGVNNGVINNMMYRVSLYDEEDGDWYAEEHLAETSYEFRVTADTPQAFYKLGVQAYTSPSTNSTLTPIEVVAGQPYALDVTEVFANNDYTYGPLYSLTTPDSFATPSWTLDYATNYWADAAITDQKMLIGQIYYGTGDCGVMLPMVATADATEVEFAIDVYSDSNVTPSMNIYAQTFGTERMPVGNIALQTEPGWHTYTFTLPEEMLNRPWIQMCIFTQFTSTSQYALIKGYRLTSIETDGVTDLLAGKVSVLASTGNIAINGAEGRNITVSDLAGKVVYSAKGQSNGIVVPAAAGVHIVRIDNKSYKVMVK